MELNVRERLMLVAILTGITTNYNGLRILRELRESLEFDEVETLEAEVTWADDGQIRWHLEKGEKMLRDIEVGDLAKSIVAQQLRKLDSSQGLMDNHFSLYEKFVEAPETVKTKDGGG